MKNHHSTRVLCCLGVALTFCTENLFAQTLGTAAGWKDDGRVVRLITSTDLVGIGTSTPDRTLTLANTVGTPNYLNVKDGTRELLLGVESGGGIISMMTNDGLIFRTGLNTERMRITADGKMGIGLQTPLEVLDVLGNIHASGMFAGSSAQISGNGALVSINHTGAAGNSTMNFQQDGATAFSIFYDQDPMSPGLKFEAQPGPIQSPALFLGDDGSVSVGIGPGPVQSPALFVGNDGSVSVGSQPGPVQTPALFVAADGSVLVGANPGPVQNGKLEIAGSDLTPSLALSHTGTSGNAAMNFRQDDVTKFSIFYDQNLVSPGLKFSSNPGPSQSPALLLGDDGSVSIGVQPGPVQSPTLLVGSDGSVSVGINPGPIQSPTLLVGSDGSVSVGINPGPVQSPALFVGNDGSVSVGVGPGPVQAKFEVEGTGDLPLLMLNHTGAIDGPGIQFSQDGIPLAAISVLGPHPHPWLEASTGFRPTGDLSGALGSPDKRWTEVWAENGMIQTSDAREKENVQDMAYGLNEILQMHPVSYTWKGRPEEGTKLGLIAQEVQPVISEVVVDKEFHHRTDGTAEVLNVDRLGMNYSALIPVLIKAIQEQQMMIQGAPSGTIPMASSKAVDPEVEALKELVAAQSLLLTGILATLEEHGMSLNQKKTVGKVDDGQGVALQAPAATSVVQNLPETYSLSVNYPNPFNPTTTIQYALPEPGNVTIEIYNMLGQKVRTMVDEFRNAGYHSVQWDGRNQAGETVSSGTYLYKMQSGNFVQTQKMMLAK